MARVAALVPDLMFGSRALELLRAAGHEAELVQDASAPAEVLVVDLTVPDVDPGAVRAAAGDTKVLGVFAHVEPEVRERALAAGFDQVVPRSRFVREGGDLVARLAAG